MYDFFDRDHAANYLVGTIIRHDGKPTVVHAVDYVNRNHRKLLLHHYSLRGEHEVRANRLEEFDFKPVKLGMYNFRIDNQIVEAAWLQRYPARRWKVGLDRQAICVIPIRKAEDNVIFELQKQNRMPGLLPWYQDEAMADCIEGVYPTLLQAMAIMGKKTRCSVAFSSNFAVTGTHKLYYRHHDQPVGVVVDGIPHLHDEYVDLSDILKEDLR